MLWNSGVCIVQHPELGQGFYNQMKSFTALERTTPAADCDATRRKTLV
jgi:hypothetical protein